MRLPASEDVPATIEALRGTYATDRLGFLAENLHLTEAEGEAFWPIYREYRAEQEKIGDGLVKLVLEYRDAYPDVSEDRARQLLNDYSSLQKEFANHRASYLKRFAKILPATKTLRFAQLENRMDLALRLQLASAVPLVPTEGRLMGTSEGIMTIIKGVPGTTIVQTRELTATVTAIDETSRKVTLLSPDGVRETVKVGPDVTNFDQIKVGDSLKITAAEELVVRMAEPGEPESNEAASAVVLAPKGAKPGGIVAETRQITVTVAAIDQQKRTATVRYEDGSTRTFPVRSDVDLSKRKVGEKVILSTTDLVAISVEKP
jgi:hypothetical protein